MGGQGRQSFAKGLPQDTRLMVNWQGMKIYIPDSFHQETLAKLFQVLKQL